MTALNKEDSLGYQINLLARLFERALRDEIAPLGVVPGQFPVLLCLYEENGLTQAEIAGRVRTEQPTIAKTLQRMERDGLIERFPDPDDRRRARIHLTSRARVIEADLASAARGVNGRAGAGLSSDDVTQLLEMLRRLAEGLAASRRP